MKFNETPICKSRANCYHCRNNEVFRIEMGKQYGEIECPENIPIGADLEELPEKSVESYKKSMKMKENREKQLIELDSIVNELYEISSEEGKKLVDDLKKILYAGRKNPEICKNGGDKIGEVEQECCGGKKAQKPAYNCSKHTIAIEKKCQRCKEFEA